MPATASASRDAPAEPVAREDLAEGLMLVRASTLKMIRLQLAMERRDQRVALEAVDDLVALDRRLQDLLESHSGSGEEKHLGHFLERERLALSAEKHTIASGFANARWTWAPDSGHPEAGQQLSAIAGEPAVERLEDPEPYVPGTPPFLKWIIILVLVGFLGAASYVLGIPDALMEVL